MNKLKMAKIESILELHAAGWSFRRIARELQIDRDTVSKVVNSYPNEPKPAIAPTGSEPSKPATFSSFPAPAENRADETKVGDSAGESKPANAPTNAPTGSGSAVCTESSSPGGPRETSRPGRPSLCTPYRELIEAKLELGLTAQRIFQDLMEEKDFQGRYPSVRRYVARLCTCHAFPVRRMECAAGEEVQVDFGKGAAIVNAEDGRRRRTHLFRIVLSHSRKAYSEVVYRQTTDDFIHCLENAFWHFGGVTKTVVIDNLKAAVKHPDWFDPELIPKLRTFCQHYGVVILPTKPRTPRHKGKIERGVGYAQDNGLRGRQFDSLTAQNEHLARWESGVADKRIHGTTRRQVEAVFQEVERPALRPLPRERFPWFEEAERTVHRDGHIEVARAYYSVPPEYRARVVWARWDARLVRVFNHRFEQIDIHVRHEPGKFSTKPAHIAPEKINSLERGVEYLLSRVERIGPQSHQWAQAMLHVRGIEGTRVLQGLIALGRKHPGAALETACQTALAHGAFRLRVIRQILKKQPEKTQFSLPFLDEHPIIRPLDDYARVVADALRRKETASRGFPRDDWTKANPSTHEKSPAMPSMTPRGSADLLPSRSGYPSLGCSPALPNSVSPDPSSVIPSSFLFQESLPHERSTTNETETTSPLGSGPVAGDTTSGGGQPPTEPFGVPGTTDPGRNPDS